MQYTGRISSRSTSFSMDALNFIWLRCFKTMGTVATPQYEGYDININKAWNYATNRGIKSKIYWMKALN